MLGYVHVSSGAVVVTSVRSLGAGVPGNCELPGIGVEFSYESSERTVYILNHRASL